MTEKKTYSEIIGEVEQETGKPVTQRKVDFALSSVTQPDQCNAQAARDAGYTGKHAKQRGHELANDSQVQTLIEKLNAEIGDPNDIVIETLVTQVLVSEMMSAKASRDRINAAEKLGKIYGMFKDGVAIQDTRTKEQILNDIEKHFGIIARRNAEQELGLT